MRLPVFNPFLFALFFLLISCGGPANEKEVSKNDTTKAPEDIGPGISMENLSALFKRKTTLPFIADSSLLENIKNYDSLGGGEVRVLDADWFKHDVISLSDYDLKEFYKIDSIKFSCTYSEFCKRLDIGMTKYANAFAISKAELDINTTLYFWAFSISSYEACPYSNTQSILCTIVYKGEVSQSFLLAEHLSAGDPPVSMERKVNGKLNKDGSIIIDKWEMNDEDMDQSFIFITKEHFEFVIKEGKVMIVKSEKNEREKTNRPVEKN